MRFDVRCPVIRVLENQFAQGATFNLFREGCVIERGIMAAEEKTVSLEITVPGQSIAIFVELGRICRATRREFGAEFKVVQGGSRQRPDTFLLEAAKRNVS